MAFCNLDSMYESDREKGNIDDDVLVKLVESNKLLYDKSDENFKNTTMKKDMWTVIAYGCGAKNGEAAEARWNTLRNMFSRKLRAMREKGPSGSRGGKAKNTWHMIGPMSFLLPHMQNRKKQGSSLSLDNEAVQQSSTPSPSPRSSPTPSTSMWDSSSDIFLDDDLSRESFEERSDRKRPRVPESDSFSQNKKKSLDKLENIMAESANAMKTMASALAESATTTEKQEAVENPYISIMKKAFAKVAPDRELECFTAIMRVMQEHT